MAENESGKEQKNLKLHYGGNEMKGQSNVAHEKDLKHQNTNLGTKIGDQMDPDRLAMDKAANDRTGRYQTTMIKGDNPEQAQSPNVGSNQDSDSEGPKLSATYGKSHSNLGTKLGGSAERGTHGLTSPASLKKENSSSQNQKLNKDSHQGDKDDSVS